MKWICFVSKENAKKVEEILKKDDICSRQSITVKDSEALGVEKEGCFVMICGEEESIERAKELIKDLTEEIEEEVLEEAKKKIEEEEEKAISGFGGIFG
jgi:Glu-tRNA(Gln) amidotransferase subunit E-like FAD-binding protein